MNSNWSYSPETPNLGQNNSWKFCGDTMTATQWKGVTDGQTEKGVLRAAWSQLKTVSFPDSGTWNVDTKFEIPRQPGVILRKPCHLQADGQTDHVNSVYTHITTTSTNFNGQGYEYRGMNASISLTAWGPGGRLNKKDGLTRYGDSHVKDKTS